MKSAMLIILLLVLSAFTWAVDANDFLIWRIFAVSN